MNCGLCQSHKYLEECSFADLGKFWICTHCYNNILLRQQIRTRFERLFGELGAGDRQAREKILALAKQYKLPEPKMVIL